MPWRSMANFFGMCRYVHPRISGRPTTVPLGLSLINKRCCLRFLGPVLASLHGVRVSRFRLAATVGRPFRFREEGNRQISVGEVHCLPISNRYKKPRLTAGLHGIRFKRSDNRSCLFRFAFRPSALPCVSQVPCRPRQGPFLRVRAPGKAPLPLP